MVPVCRQNVIGPAQLLVLSSIADQPLDTCPRVRLDRLWRGEAWGIRGVTAGAGAGTVFLKDVDTEGHDEHPKSLCRVPVTSSGPTLLPAEARTAGTAPQAGLAGQGGHEWRQPFGTWGLLISLLCSPVMG